MFELKPTPLILDVIRSELLPLLASLALQLEARERNDHAAALSDAARHLRHLTAGINRNVRQLDVALFRNRIMRPATSADMTEAEDKQWQALRKRLLTARGVFQTFAQPEPATECTRLIKMLDE